MNFEQTPEWLPMLLGFGLLPLAALVLLGLARMALARLLRGRDHPMLERVLHAGHFSLQVGVVLMVLSLTLPVAGLAPENAALASNALGVVLTMSLGWTLTRKVAAAFDAKLDGDVPGDDDLARRRHRTQMVVFRRLAVAAGSSFTVGLVLTSIPAVRAVGLSLFASAGMAGIVMGIAARSTVSNLIAGLQIALSQPIRLGDAVTVEGHWGRVAEITSSYVTIITWDQRSLVVPLNYFVEKPIINWTKDTAQLLDTVLLYLDHGAPIGAIREELDVLLADCPAWDNRIAKVHVTAWKENCIEVRILLSAADAPRMFEVRCVVREGLLDWLMREHPEAMPRQRQQTLAAT